MTKITLDDIEYDSEDFSEDQTSLLKEIGPSPISIETSFQSM